MEIWIYIAIFIGIDLIILFFVFSKLKKKKFSAAEQKKFSTYRQKISSEPDRAKAVMAADNLLDEVLKKKGYSGSLGEKLKKARPLFSSNNQLWDAHKLRNRVAHELNASVSANETFQALQSFKKALKDLGVKI